MRVTLRESCEHGRQRLAAGVTIDVDAATAAVWIARGWAESAEPVTVNAVPEAKKPRTKPET